MIAYTVGLILSVAMLIYMNFYDGVFGVGIIFAILGVMMMQFGSRIIQEYAEENDR